MSAVPRIPRRLARRIDRLSRRAHAFHRFAHHPLCGEYAGEVVRAGRRTRICLGCALALSGAIAGAALGLALPLPPAAAAVSVAAAFALASIRSRRIGKLARRFLPASMLAAACVSGSWALAGIAAAVLGVRYRRRGPDRAPCAACPERSGPGACRGFAEIARRERAFRRAAGSLLSAIAVCTLGCGGGEPARPNILLVSVDCLRADHLGCYGYPRATAPAIDALARDGVRFERAFSASGWTLPSHLTMLTGLPMSVHGVDDDRLWARIDSAGAPLPVPLRGVFVPEILREAGYATAGFYTVKWLDPQFGFGPGFDTWERMGHSFNSHPVVGPIYRRIKADQDREGLVELRKTYPELFDRNHPSTPETVDAAIGWLDENRRTAGDRPFFLFLHLFDAHDPYTPPAGYEALFEPGPGDPAIERMIADYDASIRSVDDGLARLLARLDALGLRESTLVVLTGDHGEEFEEHGHREHRFQLFLESVRVPLVLRWPAGLPAGRVVRGNAGHADVAPTLYAAAGVRPRGPVLGTDLLPIARGEAENGIRTYLSELTHFVGGPVPERHLTIARGDELRVLRCAGRSPWSGVRFDLASNPDGRGPGEALDRGGPEGARLEKELAELRAIFAEARAALPPRGHGMRPLTDRDREEITALGYAGDAESIPGEHGDDRLFLDGGVWPDE